jgi:hypothetical protein
MCIVIAPAVLAGVAIAASVASTAVGVVGAIAQGQAQARAAEYNAKVAENNAIAARQQQELNRQQALEEARAAADQGARQAERIRRQNRAATAGQINTLLNSGATASGSALDVMTDTAVVMETEALDAQYRTGLELWQNRNRAAADAYNSEVLARKEQAQAGLYRMEARNARRSAMFNAIGAAVGGIGSVANSAHSFYRR